MLLPARLLPILWGFYLSCTEMDELLERSEEPEFRREGRGVSGCSMRPEFGPGNAPLVVLMLSRRARGGRQAKGEVRLLDGMLACSAGASITVKGFIVIAACSKEVIVGRDSTCVGQAPPSGVRFCKTTHGMVNKRSPPHMCTCHHSGLHLQSCKFHL
jgi:hypothetical protein